MTNEHFDSSNLGFSILITSEWAHETDEFELLMVLNSSVPTSLKIDAFQIPLSLIELDKAIFRLLEILLKRKDFFGLVAPLNNFFNLSSIEYLIMKKY